MLRNNILTASFVFDVEKIDYDLIYLFNKDN